MERSSTPAGRVTALEIMSLSVHVRRENGYDHEYLAHGDDPHLGPASPGKVGMWMVLLADALSFFALLLTYGVLRARAEVWRPSYLPELGITVTAAMTFLLVCSSVTMVLAHQACVAGDRRRTARFLAATIAGGLLFLGGQAYEYGQLIAAGMELGNSLATESAYAPTFFVITSFHGVHVLAGVVYLAVMLVNTGRGVYDGGGPQAANSIEIAGLFWHFVDLVWILVFTLVYLMPQ
jgi:cytochrome c oxidase subunit III